MKVAGQSFGKGFWSDLFIARRALLRHYSAIFCWGTFLAGECPAALVALHERVKPILPAPHWLCVPSPLLISALEHQDSCQRVAERRCAPAALLRCPSSHVLMRACPTAGDVKRWNHHRGPMTHGSKSHRQHGSVGASATPGRVLPGLKMAGHLGAERVKIRKLQVSRQLVR